MKKLVSLALAFTLIVSLSATALAGGGEGPERPEWIPEELPYVTVPSDRAYGGESWAKITEYRAAVERGQDLSVDLLKEWGRGGSSVGWDAEMGYLAFRAGLVTGENDYFDRAAYYFGIAANSYVNRGGMKGDATWARLRLWYVISKSRLWTESDIASAAEDVWEVMCLLDMDAEELLALPYIDGMSPDGAGVLKWALEEQKDKLSGRVELYLDGYVLRLEDGPEPVIWEGRTMVPVRSVAERLGAAVEWDPDTRTATITRVDTEIKMTLDSDLAYVNGEERQMDVAPLNIEGRILIPVRYMAEFFGQSVGWNAGLHRVTIAEDKTGTDEALEKTALAMGAYIADANWGEPLIFGMWRRGNAIQYRDASAGIFDSNPTALPYERARMILRDSWGIFDREGLVGQTQALTTGGHDADFKSMAEDIGAMDGGERALYGALYGENYLDGTEYLSEKWGDKGILAWDLYRVSTLAQWGYEAGYVTFDEALELVRPAAEKLADTFGTWEEAMENYVDGYLWWDGSCGRGLDPWETDRGRECLAVIKNYPEIFDDSLLA